ncbi:MAG TPA: penicillin-binding protein 2 [Syntrophobacteraceae bacterium]|nr:penicillin-binding protein 2 [Syntrophobacteraceae bacterium]
MNNERKKFDSLKLINWENAESASFQKQYILVWAIMLLLMMVYMVRLWYLQVIQGESYRYQSENNRIRLEDIAAPRGIIFDRNGVPIVENRPAYHLVIIREDISDLDATIRELARLCARNPDDFFSIIEADKAIPRFIPIRLASDLDRDCLARLEAQRVRLPGVEIEVEPKREYRWNTTAAHLMGYLSEITEAELKSEKYRGYYPGEDIGKVGIESAFEEELHGSRGGRQLEVDAAGRKVRLLEEHLPVAGRNLWLTLDMDLQKTAESLLEDKTGAIVAVDPTDGAVLAFACSPSFDQEKFVRGLSKDEWTALSKDPRHPLMNRGSGAAYPPGSTYKPFVALAALREGAITAASTFPCPGYLQFADRSYRCWKECGHGALSVERALIESCDVFFYQAGLKLGVDRLAQGVALFGLGEKTGIGLGGEQRGLIPTSWWKKQATGIPWQKGETISISIGQGFDLVTPLQMAMGYSAIANDGKLWQPYVVKRIEGGSANGIDEIKPKLKRRIAIEQRCFDLVKKALLGVVEDPRGTGHLICDPRIHIAGKTGTAQVVHVGQGVNRKLLERLAKSKDRDHAWFIGYAPASDPRICVAALVEHGGHGASAAAPLVRQVILAYLKGGDKQAQR